MTVRIAPLNMIDLTMVESLGTAQRLEQRTLLIEVSAQTELFSAWLSLVWVLENKTMNLHLLSYQN